MPAEKDRPTSLDLALWRDPATSPFNIAQEIASIPDDPAVNIDFSARVIEHATHLIQQQREAAAGAQWSAYRDTWPTYTFRLPRSDEAADATGLEVPNVTDAAIWIRPYRLEEHGPDDDASEYLVNIALRMQSRARTKHLKAYRTHVERTHPVPLRATALAECLEAKTALAVPEETRPITALRYFSGRPGVQLVLASSVAVTMLVVGIVLAIAAAVSHPLRPNPYIAVTLLISGTTLFVSLMLSLVEQRQH